MPALPWKECQAVDPGRQYAAMASRLPLRAHRSVPGFLLDAMRIRGQLAHAPGLVGYALDAQPARKTFWTFSVWEDEQSLAEFAAADPHRLLARELKTQLTQSRFEFFAISGGELPLDWDQVRRRLEKAEKQ
jgi:heme-degrading monooxygenase HmoA